MILSEYTSKEILSQYGVAVPPARLAKSGSEAETAAKELGARKFVVKAQIAAGGRALGGGVKFAATPSVVRSEAEAMLGGTLVTEQTGPGGEVVKEVSIEAAVDTTRQCYAAIVLDPDTGYPLLLASTEGGTEFEARAATSPDIVSTLVLSDDADLKGFLAGLDMAGAEPAIRAMSDAFTASDMTLLEINPLAETSAGAWIALDAKATVDPNALFRRPEFEGLAASQPGTGIEAQAQKSNINLVQLDGSLGVVVNGAGLGLATNDMIVDAGGNPANFMDIRTTATSFDIAKGVSLLLDDPGVKAVLLNVHGGGMTVCDTVAEGVAFAYARATRKPPVIARLAGVNADWGTQILKDRKVPVEIADSLKGAVARAVELAGGAA